MTETVHIRSRDVQVGDVVEAIYWPTGDVEHKSPPAHVVYADTLEVDYFDAVRIVFDPLTDFALDGGSWLHPDDVWVEIDHV